MRDAARVTAMLDGRTQAMSTLIHPVRNEEDRSAGGDTSVEERLAQARKEDQAWHLGRSGRDDNDPMAGMRGSQVDLTRVLRGRKLRR
jgi:hypothetical protein